MADNDGSESAPSNQLATAEILARLKARDPAYLKALFTEVNPYLLRVCGANKIHSENAEEVIHQTWETFFSNLDKFEGRSQIRTYICGVLFNKIREHRRAQDRFVYDDDSEKLFGQAFNADGSWHQKPSSPHRLLELRQSSALVEECLDGLSAQQRAAFVLREVDDEDSDDICSQLGITLAHLRVLLFRAKDKLKLCLEGKVSLE